MTSKGYAITDTKKWTEFTPTEYKLKTASPDDVDVAISHCGICGSDIHTITGGWGAPKFLPLVVGHEIVGKVTNVGANVKDIKVGDRVGVGAQISSCANCGPCKNDDENYCLEAPVDTYNDYYSNGEQTQGGYSTNIRAHQQFVFPVPEAIKSEHACVMFCAGLTVYSPLLRNNAGPGSRVGIVGIGGLGHFGVLFSAAMGAHTIAISHSPSKREDALKMGAKEFVSTKENPEFWDKNKGSLDLIICTANSNQVSVPKMLGTLRPQGKLVFVGIPEDSLGDFRPGLFMSNGSFIGSSHIGSKKEVASMLKLAAEKNVQPLVEVMPMNNLPKAVQRMKDGDVKYRFVLEQDLA